MAVNINIPKPTYTKNDIGLGNVDNTSDLNKPISTATQTALDGKVDKVTGKGLSENDFTNTLKTKLDGIEAGAEVNVNADWNATSGDAQILNKPTIPSVTGLVPYTGATADVDLDTFGLDAKFIKIKGTGGNGHLNLKHQSSGATAGGSESVLYADNSGNPKWKNDGNAVQDVLLSGATTADIADSINKRYVTDAQLTVIGNTSGTNTGDETQATIISKLGYTPQAQFLSKLVFKEVYGGTTSSTSETILATFAFSANELPTSTTLYFETLAYKTAAIVNGVFRIRVNTSNTLVGATQIAQWSMGGNTSLHSQARRRFGLNGGNIIGIVGVGSALNTDIITSTSAETIVAADVTNALYFFITFTSNSSADTLNHVYSLMKNF